MSIAEIFRKKISAVAPWRLLWHLILVAFLSGIVSAIFYKPAKTNGMYLQELIDNHMLEQFTAKFVNQLRRSSQTEDYEESDWKQIEEGISGCLVKKAVEYAASNDSCLNLRANMETPTELASHFLKTCGAID